ncbi:amidohydrolase [Candidatus Epulonipiscium fishelsonii]|uniref:Amidohydrolase n=1 Tax=Candidatus Epulonipiscium fishelsonii TaxID=77094 RepID=A0ACC8XCF1_9FIRM|nr:amidohydrolase [Epulopiscium sp. SCG-B11WGA-EpuloA1]ONI41843.1 amidohydrolase [Epulopiscium sp. SCG-B05WGA-EpuloA1]
MIAIKGGTVITITNGVLENAVILVEEGKIKAIGTNVEIPEDAQIIDASKHYVMPGLIDAHTHISTFNEPGTFRGPYDGNEMSSPITPYVRAMDALNPDDYAIDKVRDAGFTTVCTLPGSANVIGGTGITFKLRGKTAAEMIIEGTEQMKMALGENPRGVYGKDGKMPMTRMGVAGILRKTLAEAKVYSDKLKEGAEPKFDFAMESLVKVVRGEMKVRIHAHRADDIMTGVRVAEEFNLDYSIEHATEGYKIADILAEKRVVCVVGPILKAPSKQELHERTPEVAGILRKAGVPICITADTASETAWLPARIGHLMRRGLEEKDAFEAITLAPAKLLGVDDKVGSLEVGKDADIAIFDGHPFSSLSLCNLVMIDGVIYRNTLEQ